MLHGRDVCGRGTLAAIRMTRFCFAGGAAAVLTAMVIKIRPFDGARVRARACGWFFKTPARVWLMLVGGANVSGTERNGLNSHAALIVGREDAINRVHNAIGIEHIHISRLGAKKQAQVLENLDLPPGEIGAWCFHIDRQRIEGSVGGLGPRKRRKPSTSIHRSFDAYWLRLFARELADFAAKLGADLSDIAVEADADMRPTMKRWNISTRQVGRAHELADAIARCNRRGVKIPNCRVMDIRDDLEAAMKRDLLK